ncbi:hypothetical protein CH254_21760 [Rhodococcus sp. 06-412-2C]|nr:hypothetical protein CH254_21760 [Rhodococcus sp. 06-412-2C]OZC93761.1 hypothetical protein CH279_19840 [Rhodococcus sp. 06-412-2B]
MVTSLGSHVIAAVGTKPSGTVPALGRGCFERGLSVWYGTSHWKASADPISATGRDERSDIGEPHVTAVIATMSKPGAHRHVMPTP